MHRLAIRIFAVISPSTVLLCLAAALGTLLWGARYSAGFVAGVAVFALGRYLDNYGLESHDQT